MFVPFIFHPQLASLAEIVAASPVAIRAAADSGRSGCPHYRTNPICRPLPHDPVVSPYSRAWADAEFQSGRDRLPSFNANTGIDALHPFEQTKDGSDPPVGHAFAGHTVAQVVVCDRVPWGEHICSAQKLSGATVRFPQGAEPAGNSDHHYTWLDDEKRGNWDCWLCNRPTTPGAQIHVGGLGFCPWDKTTPGDELGTGTDCSNATATNIETTLGSVAQTDFTAAEADPEHGTFGHAIAFSALCADPSFVAPASASDGANTNGTAACAKFLGAHQRPPEGTRVYLAMSDREVDALSLPAYDKAFLRTLDREHYGGIVTDTNWSGAQGLSPAFRRDDFGAEAKEAGVVPAPFAQIPLELGSIDLGRDMRFCASGDCR
jgi:hypothetical protein